MDSRPVSLLAEDRDLILIVDRLTTLWALRRSWQATVPALTTFLRAANNRLLLRVKWLGDMELAPSPGFLLRLILPSPQS